MAEDIVKTRKSGGSNLARATIRGVVWNYVSQFSGKFLVFISTIILAWLLTKSDFGIVGYALVVFNFLDILSDLGVGVALIYYRDEPKATQTAFWLGLGISLILAIAMWSLAPWIGQLLALNNEDGFDQQLVINLTRALSIIFPLESLRNVHSALLQKELAFSRKFIPDLARSMSKGLISIVFALLGFGAWSLVLGQIGGVIVSVFFFWRVMPWRPSFYFSPGMARPLLSYGSSMVAVSLLGTAIRNVDYLLIGPYLGAAALGVYTLAFRLPEFLILQTCTLIGKVIFPAYSKIRENEGSLSRAFLTTMSYVSMLTVPLGLGMALVAGPLIRTVFPDRWVEAIPVTRAIAIYALCLSLTYNIGDVYKAQGRPSLLTRLSLVNLVVLLPALWWAVAIVGDITTVAWTQTIVSLGYVVLNFFVASRTLDVPVRKIIEALLPALLAGMMMAVTVSSALLVLSQGPSLLQLIGSVITGALTYVAALWWLQQDLVLQASHTLRAALVGR